MLEKNIFSPTNQARTNQIFTSSLLVQPFKSPKNIFFRLLVPAANSLLETLKQSNQHSHFHKLLKDSEIRWKWI